MSGSGTPTNSNNVAFGGGGPATSSLRWHSRSESNGSSGGCAAAPDAQAETFEAPRSSETIRYQLSDESRYLTASQRKYVVVMIGLPARGKTYLAQKMSRMLAWLGHGSVVHNVQAAYRASLNPPRRLELADFDFRDETSETFSNYMKALDRVGEQVADFFARRKGLVAFINDDFVSERVRDEVERRIGRHADQTIYIEVTRDAEINIKNDLEKILNPREFGHLGNEAELVRARNAFYDRVALLRAQYTSIKDSYDSRQKKMLQEEQQQQQDQQNSGHTAAAPAAVSSSSSSSSSAAVAAAGVVARTGACTAPMPLSYILLHNSVHLQAVGVRGYLPSRLTSTLLNLGTQRQRYPIYFSRHGESKYNLEDRIGGDPPLSEKGMQDAKYLRDFIGLLVADYKRRRAAADAAGVKFDEPPPQIWSSQLLRTMQTSQPAVDAFGLERLTWHQLNEIHAGVCEDMTYTEVKERYPSIDHFRAQAKYSFRYPQGESYQDIVQRLEPLILELENSEREVIVVAHQAILRCLLSYFGHKSAESSVNQSVPHRTIWRCTYNADGISSLDELKLPLDADTLEHLNLPQTPAVTSNQSGGGHFNDNGGTDAHSLNGSRMMLAQSGMLGFGSPSSSPITEFRSGASSQDGGACAAAAAATAFNNGDDIAAPPPQVVNTMSPAQSVASSAGDNRLDTSSL